MLAEDAPHCLEPEIGTRDARAAQAVGRLLNRSVRPGERLVLRAEQVARLREGFRSGGIRAACAGCNWDGLCREVAANGYAGVILPVPCR